MHFPYISYLVSRGPRQTHDANAEHGKLCHHTGKTKRLDQRGEIVYLDWSEAEDEYIPAQALEDFSPNAIGGGRRGRREFWMTI